VPPLDESDSRSSGTLSSGFFPAFFLSLHFFSSNCSSLKAFLAFSLFKNILDPTPIARTEPPPTAATITMVVVLDTGGTCKSKKKLKSV
jgi:hypothetical protein